MRLPVSLVPVNGTEGAREAFIYFKTQTPKDIERRELLAEYPLDGGYKPKTSRQ